MCLDKIEPYGELDSIGLVFNIGYKENLSQ